HKKLINFWSIFFIVYFLTIATTKVFYDRYILMLVPVAILWLVTLNPVPSKIEQVFLSLVLVILAIYGYQFSADFILTNQYIWNRSEQLAKQQNIEKSKIQGTNAWKLSYRNLQRDYIYDFT